ncbi:hypothetical protein D3C73_1321660 [compost metagenome]
MAVSVQQSRSDVSPGGFDYPGAFADHVRDVLTNVGNASTLYSNGHPLQNFTGTNIDQPAPGNDQSSGQIAAGGGHKLRHTVRERFSYKRHVSHSFRFYPVYIHFHIFSKNGLTVPPGTSSRFRIQHLFTAAPGTACGGLCRHTI